MYQTIVAWKVRKTFADLSRQNPRALTLQLDESFQYHFRGSGPLSGLRTTTPTLERWFDRIYRLFPLVNFRVNDVAVSGPPWRTVVMTHVDVVAEGYENEMFQKIHLRWGKITNIITLENLECLNQHLKKKADAGDQEACAPPYVD